MPYVVKDWRMGGRAWLAVAHSEGWAAPAQEFDLGAICWSWAAVRVERWAIGVVRAVGRRDNASASAGRRVVESMILRFLVIVWLLVRLVDWCFDRVLLLLLFSY